MEGFEQVVALQSTVYPPEESYSINQILELCTLETVLYKFQRRLPEDRVALQFRTYLCMMPLATVNKGTFIYLQSIGKALASTMISLVREVVFGVGFALLLPLWFGLDGVLYSMPVSDILTFVIAVLVIAATYRQLSAHVQELKHEDQQMVSGNALADIIVTIGRSFGSGGRTIGRLVAEKMNIQYYTQKMERTRTRYKIVKREDQADGSIKLWVRKQYNDKIEVDEYFNL